MQLLILFFYLLSVEAVKPSKICDVLSMDTSKQCYIKEILAKITHCPNQITFDRTTNSLYFSLDTGDNTYIPTFFRMDNKKMGILKGIKDAFTVASDYENFNIYFGGNHGIYKYNTMFKILKRLLIPHLDIWWLFVKKNIYFIQFPSLKAYQYSEKVIEEVPELENKTVHQFVLDYKDNFIFVNSSGLYSVKKGGYNAKLLKSGRTFLSVAVDNNNIVHVCGDDAIFVVSRIKQKVMRIITIPGVTGIAFDKSNNIIYCDAQEIARLIPVSQDIYNKMEKLNNV